MPSVRPAAAAAAICSRALMSVSRPGPVSPKARRAMILPQPAANSWISWSFWGEIVGCVMARPALYLRKMAPARFSSLFTERSSAWQSASWPPDPFTLPLGVPLVSNTYYHARLFCRGEVRQLLSPPCLARRPRNVVNRRREWRGHAESLGGVSDVSVEEPPAEDDGCGGLARGGGRPRGGRRRLHRFPDCHARPGLSAGIPVLVWEKHSDWVNLKTDVTPAAVGDGKADDTAAIQKAFNGVRDGSVLYFPPGVYRITAPLVAQEPQGAPVDRRADRRLRPRHPAGLGRRGRRRTMLHPQRHRLFAIRRLRTGRPRKAGVGFPLRRPRGFQTEVTHRHLAFRGFTDSARPGGHRHAARRWRRPRSRTACSRTADAAWPSCSSTTTTTPSTAASSAAAASPSIAATATSTCRNCHFEGSRDVDIRDCVRARQFDSPLHLDRLEGLRDCGASSVAPLTIQDCRVDGWTSPRAPSSCRAPPCCCSTASSPTRHGTRRPPARRPSAPTATASGCSSPDNRVDGAPGLVPGGGRPALMPGPARASATGVIRSAGQSFLREEVRIPSRVFDARRDFGARGDGVADDTAADPEGDRRRGGRAGMRSPTCRAGTYVVTRTLQHYRAGLLRGRQRLGHQADLEGAPRAAPWSRCATRSTSRWRTSWSGATTLGAMNNGIDIHQTGSAGRSRMTYDGVYVYGMYQKQPFRKGLRFTGLGERDVVRDAARPGQPALHRLRRGRQCWPTAPTKARWSSRGRARARRAARLPDAAGDDRDARPLPARQPQHRDERLLRRAGRQRLPVRGRARTTRRGGPRSRAAKFHSFPSGDPAKNTHPSTSAVTAARSSSAPYQFYQEPKLMRIRQQGGAPVELFLVGCKPVRARGLTCGMGPGGPAGRHRE